MGCSATKAVIPIIAEGSADTETTEETSNHSSETLTVPAVSLPESDDITISARTTNGLAFEVPISEDENVIKKHPPKRFQRLEDQQMSCLTHRLLDEKQAEAEQRRLQILSQRIQSAKSRQKLKRSFVNNGESNDLLIESMHQEPSTVAL